MSDKPRPIPVGDLDLPWNDWSVAAWVNVDARTVEEADRKVRALLVWANDALQENHDCDWARGSGVRLADEHALPEPS